MAPRHDRVFRLGLSLFQPLAAHPGRPFPEPLAGVAELKLALRLIDEELLSRLDLKAKIRRKGEACRPESWSFSTTLPGRHSPVGAWRHRLNMR